jgi:hypothetical protein
MDIDSISVIDGWFPTVVIVLTIVTLLASLGWRATRTRRRRRSPSSANGPRRKCAGDRPGGGSYC